MVGESQLRGIPFFRNLPASALEAITARLQLVSFGQGQIVFRRGDPSDAMYLVESGQVDVVLAGDATPAHDEEPLASLGPGSFVGELGLLLSEPRSATLVASADSELWALGRADLEALLTEYPVLGLDLSRELGRRLVATNRRIVPPATTRFTALWGSGVDALAQALVDAECGRIGVVALPGCRPLPTLPEEVIVLIPDLDAEAVSAWAGQQVEGLDQLLMVLPEELSGVSRAAGNLAEHVVSFDGDVPGWARRGGLAHRALRCDGSAASLRRVTRWLSGRAVGLALSSGGSKCVAHIGVIRVLRSLGVEIDAVAGTSGGALVGAGVAFNLSDQALSGLVGEIARLTRFHRFDFNLLPRSALFKGVKLRAFFESYLGGRTFADAAIPFWVVSADVTSGEEVVIAEGPVSDGLRASMSIPVALNPWSVGGRLLMDGAVVNPLPASVLREAGLRVIIGSSVAGQDVALRGAQGRVPHALQIVSRMMNSMERELIGAQLPLVDITIRPRVYASSSFDFSRIEAFIAEGERAAKEQITALEELTGAARG